MRYRKPSRLDRSLEQTEVWRNNAGRLCRINEMRLNHVENLIDYITRNAMTFKRNELDLLDRIIDARPHEHRRAIKRRMAIAHTRAPIYVEWSPLMKALVDRLRELGQ